MANKALSAAFYLLHMYSTAVDNGAMNNFGICLQKCKEHFKSRMLFFVVNGALKSPRYWQLRDDAGSDVETSGTPRFSYTYGAMNFMLAFEIRSLIAKAVRDGVESLKGSHRMSD